MHFCSNIKDLLLIRQHAYYKRWMGLKLWRRLKNPFNLPWWLQNRDSGAFKSMLLKGLFERSCQISWSNLSLKNIHRKYHKFENLKQYTYLSKIDIATCLVFLLNIINRIVWIYVEKLWKASHFQCFHWFSPKICFVYFWVSQFA